MQTEQTLEIQTPSLPIEATTMVKMDGRRGPRKRPAGWTTKLRRQFPAIPVRGLWDQASEEDRGRAQQFAVIIMEYWLGHRTRIDAEKELGMKPIRFWQLTQQAVAGMCAGLLTQPKIIKGQRMGLTDQDEIKKLKKKIQELERTVETQTQLIAILRSMPGCREVKLEKAVKKITNEVRSGSEGKNRALVKKRSPRSDE